MFPDLFHIGPVTIHSYGTLLMLGFVAGILLAREQARRLNLSLELAIDLGTWALVAGVVFARATFVALNWQDFALRPVEAVYIWRQGGLSFHGGLLGGVLAGLMLGWRRGVSFWSLADMAAPGLALGYGIARLGCFLNGCCFGAPTSLPWGTRFAIFPDSLITTEPSHPTQIYAALGSFLILFLLLWARRRLGVPGQLFLLYLALYSVMRSGVEVLRRGYTAWTLVDGLTRAQVASAVILVGAVTGLVLLHRHDRREAIPPGNGTSE